MFLVCLDIRIGHVSNPFKNLPAGVDTSHSDRLGTTESALAGLVACYLSCRLCGLRVQDPRDVEPQ